MVPCFNYARFLEECVGSLLRQSYTQWECLIIDDGSTDHTPQICVRLSEKDSRVKFLRQANGGLSAARNSGIRLAQGEFLQFLDADDLLESDKLNVQVAFLQKHPEEDIVIGGAAFFEGHPPYKVRDWPVQRQVDLCAFVEKNVCPVNAPLVRKSVLDRVGLFDESLRAHEDWDLWLRCGLQGRRFAFHAEARDRALVRRHGASMSAARELMLRTAITLRQRLDASLSEALRADNAVRIAETKWRLGLHLIAAGQAQEGWALYRDGLRSAPHKAPALFRLPFVVPGVASAVRAGRRLFS